jgi:two-component system NtrC family sensor kinase
MALERCRAFIAKQGNRDDAESQFALQAIDVSTHVSEVLDDGTTRIATVVQPLRGFVALDEAERKLFDVRETIDAVLAVLAPSIREGIEVVRSYPESLSSVMGSPAKLNHALLSVLQNSVQAIEVRGEIRITVHDSEDAVEVELADNGRGIPEQMVSEIFEISLTQKKGRVGMRLGLPMSKRSIEEMGGRLTLESVEGQGTTVRVTLPAASRSL